MSDNNMPAFPVTEEHDCNYGSAGMTLRDYFAAKVAQTIVQGASVDNYGALAVDAYKLADSMMKARGTPQPKENQS